MRSLVLSLSIAVAAAACTPGAETSPSGAATPAEAVAEWAAAVDALEVERIDALVVEGSWIVIMAVENDLEPQVVSVLLDEGVPEDLATDYWRSFRDEFATFAGRPLSTLTVGEWKEYQAEGETFAAVDVFGESNVPTTVLTRGTEEGWRVDPVATLAPGLIRPLGRYFDGLSGEGAEAVVAAYREYVAPSLWAALGSGRFDEAFAREALALIERIDGAGA
ncbi:MAG TPA: hypothetical protein ENK55_03920 [Actinobacteria bacterium]|nr:hypothetical protein [Actinomycetota bacterium]